MINVLFPGIECKRPTHVYIRECVLLGREKEVQLGKGARAQLGWGHSIFGVGDECVSGMGAESFPK